MTDHDKLALWQATFDMAVYKLEKRTGLRLTGLSPPEMILKVKEWARAHKTPRQRMFTDQEQRGFAANKSGGANRGILEITNT